MVEHEVVSFLHVCICCRYECMFSLSLLLACVNVMVMSAVYEESCSGAGGSVMSDVYMLKSLGERIPS